VFVPRLARRDQRDTKDRLVAAATTLFAERGFHGTTVRDIAERAGANVAAGNYHYGSKKALYLEVLRAQFAEVRALLDAQGANPAPAAFARLDRDALTRILRTRVRLMLEMLIGPPPGVHGTLMQREMVDPSEAMPVIVGEFIRPMMTRCRAIVAQPRARVGTPQRRAMRAEHRRARGLFYSFTMPALLAMLDVPGIPARPRPSSSPSTSRSSRSGSSGSRRAAIVGAIVRADCRGRGARRRLLAASRVRAHLLRPEGNGGWSPGAPRERSSASVPLRRG
jgi:AcrR family transcriptional regulator